MPVLKSRWVDPQTGEVLREKGERVGVRELLALRKLGVVQEEYLKGGMTAMVAGQRVSTASLLSGSTHSVPSTH